jgi:ABC-type Mn2+/Zn2+ transport system ATPase subunit
MAEALISFQDVALGYDGRPVLEGLNLDVQAGDSLALLGPNGCGKSTILRAMAGIMAPLGGSIRSAAGDRPVRIGYVPQREMMRMVFPLTVFEVALMGAYGLVGPGRRVTRLERAQVYCCLEEVGLADLARKPYPVLSGGQRQRVLIARALAAKPDIVLLDEPLNGVDLQAAQAIMGLIAQLHRERGLTVVLVSHHLKMMRERDMVREVMWVHEGHLLRGPAGTMLDPRTVSCMLGAEIG